MRAYFLGIFALPFLAALLAGPTEAQSVRATAQAAPAVKGVRRVVVKIAIPSGYHIYGPKEQTGIPTEIALKGPKDVTIKPIYPKARVYESRTGVQQVYAGTVTIPVEVRAAKGVKGKKQIQMEVRTQLCNDRVCLPPATSVVSASVTL